MSENTASEGDYFLSYSRSDERFALRLAKDLRDRGVAMWVDQLDIRPSEHWDRAIERAVGNCRGLIVILSPRSVKSDNVADEISFAIDNGKSVLPVMIERCTLPLRLTRMQVVDATENYERALQQCIDELMRRGGSGEIASSSESPRPLLDAAAVASVKTQLATILGPIAAHLVDKAAARATSIGELYGVLAQRIEDERERQRFLALGSQTSGKAHPSKAEASPNEVRRGAIPSTELETMARLMTKYLGPIATIVVQREGRVSASLDDLRQQLAALIPDPHERAEFLRQVAG